MRLRRLLLLGIVMTLSGCDNVAWGGFQVGLQTSADRLGAVDSTAVDTAEVPEAHAESEASVDVGPLLLVGRPGSSGLTLSLVGHLTEEGLAGVEQGSDAMQRVAARLGGGSRFTLYSEGVRVGSVRIEAAGPSAEYCGPRPSVVGIPELVGSAQDARQFVAIESDDARSEYGEFRDESHNYDQRVASLAMMRDAIPGIGATWPESILAIRRDIQVFGTPGRTPTIAATFVYRDDLVVGPAPADAYSVFILGDETAAGYAPSYLDYRRVGDSGKAAPRFFDRLDWDGDGEPEVLIEVLGESQTWIAALDRTADGWAQVYVDGCGLPATTTP